MMHPTPDPRPDGRPARRDLGTIVIVDDNPLFRAQARRLLEAEGFSVIGEAGTGEAAFEAARALSPDVVLLDIVLPDADGLDIARRLVDAGLPPNVVLTSSRDAASYGPRIARSGARGFVPKDELSGAAIVALIGRD
jgi:DNA-binding NarL/FixJ family response regulator